MAVLALAGCSPPPQAPSPRLDPARVARIIYVCEDERTVQALYPDRKTAQVKLDGEMHQMTLTVSGGGARYVGDGLQWWTKGDEAMLAPLRTGEEIAGSPGVRCVPPARAPVEWAEPGAPGGLPDDRTPPDERLARPGSAQAAYTVVETYYALLETGRTADAAKLRTDGVEEDLKPYATLSANIGAAGRVRAAAGALQVEAPVVLYGRLASDGRKFFRSGKVTLTRAGDAPGLTPGQQMWRIAKIDLEP